MPDASLIGMRADAQSSSLGQDSGSPSSSNIAAAEHSIPHTTAGSFLIPSNTRRTTPRFSTPPSPPSLPAHDIASTPRHPILALKYQLEPPRHFRGPAPNFLYLSHGCWSTLAFTRISHVGRLTMASQQPPSQPRAYSQAYLPNGGPQPGGPVPGARPLDPNQGRVQQVGHARVLCVADVRGKTRHIVQWASWSSHH